MIDNFFEMLMLLCFAAAWPLAIHKSWVSKSTKGKSLVFLLVLIVGYIFGIINKIVMDQVNYVVFFYVLDLALVSIDTALYFRNRMIERGQVR